MSQSPTPPRAAMPVPEATATGSPPASLHGSIVDGIFQKNTLPQVEQMVRKLDVLQRDLARRLEALYIESIPRWITFGRHIHVITQKLLPAARDACQQAAEVPRAALTPTTNPADPRAWTMETRTIVNDAVILYQEQFQTVHRALRKHDLIGAALHLRASLQKRDAFFCTDSGPKNVLFQPRLMTTWRHELEALRVDLVAQADGLLETEISPEAFVRAAWTYRCLDEGGSDLMRHVSLHVLQAWRARLPLVEAPAPRDLLALQIHFIKLKSVLQAVFLDPSSPIYRDLGCTNMGQTLESTVLPCPLELDPGMGLPLLDTLQADMDQLFGRCVGQAISSLTDLAAFWSDWCDLEASPSSRPRPVPACISTRAGMLLDQEVQAVVTSLVRVDLGRWAAAAARLVGPLAGPRSRQPWLGVPGLATVAPMQRLVRHLVPSVSRALRLEAPDVPQRLLRCFSLIPDCIERLEIDLPVHRLSLLLAVKDAGLQLTGLVSETARSEVLLDQGPAQSLSSQLDSRVDCLISSSLAKLRRQNMHPTVESLMSKQLLEAGRERDYTVTRRIYSQSLWLCDNVTESGSLETKNEEI